MNLMLKDILFHSLIRYDTKDSMFISKDHLIGTLYFITNSSNDATMLVRIGGNVIKDHHKFKVKVEFRFG